MNKTTKRYLVGTVIVLIALSVYFYLKTQTQVLDTFTQENLQSFISGYGAWAPVVFIAVEIIAVIISQLPNIPLTLVAGAIWGPFLGAAYAVTGGLIGGCIAFYISRLLGKELVKKLIGDRYKMVEKIPENYLTVGVFLTRLVPFLSFDIISYGAGLTNMKFKHFFWASLLGMIPMTLLFTYLGESLMISSVWSWVFTGFVVIVMLAIPYFLKKKGWYPE